MRVCVCFARRRRGVELVRWRAARVLGELATPSDDEGGDGADAVLAALRQAERAEPAFEVAFEMADAARRIAARGAGGGTSEVAGGSGPVWKQIQDGALSSDQGQKKT